eukprot:8158480-Pyramimonas_sp.AAC.1
MALYRGFDPAVTDSFLGLDPVGIESYRTRSRFRTILLGLDPTLLESCQGWIQLEWAFTKAQPYFETI